MILIDYLKGLRKDISLSCENKIYGLSKESLTNIFDEYLGILNLSKTNFNVVSKELDNIKFCDLSVSDEALILEKFDKLDIDRDYFKECFTGYYGKVPFVIFNCLEDENKIKYFITPIIDMSFKKINNKEKIYSESRFYNDNYNVNTKSTFLLDDEISSCSLIKNISDENHVLHQEEFFDTKNIGCINFNSQIFTSYFYSNFDNENLKKVRDYYYELVISGNYFVTRKKVVLSGNECLSNVFDSSFLWENSRDIILNKKPKMIILNDFGIYKGNDFSFGHKVFMEYGDGYIEVNNGCFYLFEQIEKMFEEFGTSIKHSCDFMSILGVQFDVFEQLENSISFCKKI